MFHIWYFSTFHYRRCSPLTSLQFLMYHPQERESRESRVYLDFGSVRADGIQLWNIDGIWFHPRLRRKITWFKLRKLGIRGANGTSSLPNIAKFPLLYLKIKELVLEDSCIGYLIPYFEDKAKFFLHDDALSTLR